jgi:23S rRNA (cytosine1962-C5)-methyltransferase
MLKIRLKKGRDKPVRGGHPWIFSGSVDSVEGEGAPGEPCTVIASSGEPVGTGYYNSRSSICVRVLSRGPEPFAESHLVARIDRAVGLRGGLARSGDTDAFRLVNAEGDFLPGLVVDAYGGGLCVQVLTAGMERLRASVLSHLEKTLRPRFVYERSDSDSRGREGLEPRSGLVAGTIPEAVTFKENGRRFELDIVNGQKTGFFLDQRDNRRLAAEFAAGRAVCDCFAYSGGFSVYALTSGARSVHAVDQSKAALETAKRNLSLNGIDSGESRFIADDVFSYLRQTTASYDLIILDPPKFAKHPGEVPRAARGYKDINLLAMKKIAPAGVIFTFSCSGAIEPRLFRQIVFAAAADSGRDIQVLRTLCAGADHPVNLGHPEGDYLKGLVLQVI